MNKILLAYGFFFLGIVSSLMISTIRVYYPSTSEIYTLLSIMTTLSLSLGVIVFLLILTSKVFDTLTNKILIWVLILADIIPPVLIFSLSMTSITLQLAFVFTLLSIIYILLIQFLLIKNSASAIEKRLKVILIGEFAVVLGILLNREGAFVQNIINNLFLRVTSPPLIVIGFGFILISIYRFPAFYEFKWRDDLLMLYILNIENKKIVFSYDFEKDSEKNQQNDDESADLKRIEKVFIGGIIGIDNLINEITNTQKRFDKIKHGDYTVLFDYPDQESHKLIFCLISKKETYSLKYFLQSLRKQFFVFYRELIQEMNNLDIDVKQLFSSFNIIIQNQLK